MLSGKGDIDATVALGQRNSSHSIDKNYDHVWTVKVDLTTRLIEQVLAYVLASDLLN